MRSFHIVYGTVEEHDGSATRYDTSVDIRVAFLVAYADKKPVNHAVFHHFYIPALLYVAFVGGGDEHIVAVLAQYGLHMTDECHIERRDYLGNDDAYIVRALLAQAHSHLIAMISHAACCLGDELHSFCLHIRGVARKSARDCRLRNTKFVGYILYGDVFRHYICF